MKLTTSIDKQIEEMAKSVCHLDRTCEECMTSFECKAMMYAKRFYDAGYRKASEVAEEIFKEINGVIHSHHNDEISTEEMYDKIYELEKKCTDGKDTNVFAKYTGGRRTKNEPKKVRVGKPSRVKAFDGEDKVETFLCYPCPECGKWIIDNENHKYCQWCGQALDWSAESTTK